MTVRVELGDRGYDVHVGVGVRSRVGPVTADTTRAQRALVVTQQPVADHWLDDVVASIDDAGLDTATLVIPDGEAHKDVATLAMVWEECARRQLRRRDVIVALGGGVVGDLAGFAAATYNRGIDVVQVPSTLLAMVDSSIGGKTGIDLPGGKNLVGAIHQPTAVVADTDMLATLPARVLREGFGEVVKHALLADRKMFKRLVAAGPELVAPGRDLSTLVMANAAIKAAVVSEDEREHGRRAHLNLGHTYAHVLEVLTGLGSWWHGEAVAVGLLVSLALGEELGHHGRDLRATTTRLLADIGLPTTAPVLDRDALFEVMARDKKSDGRIRWVVLDRIGTPTLITPDPAAIEAAIARVEDPNCSWPPTDAGTETGSPATELPTDDTPERSHA
ncbi:MAG TPA: 3-dehydroquinate synthase [Nitriliruptoraceae bacterium]|nr:3-dehydroquinate synthase [Nitriliruptoraceae bacterium]